MKKQLTAIALLVVATLTFAFAANAQQRDIADQQQMQTQQTLQQYYVAPPQAQNQFYFGMRLELNRSYGATTLRIVDVTWGSPAQRAGLEIGDEIRTVNGRGFQFARDSFDAVNMMNRFVSFNGPGTGPAPAAAASVQGQAQALTIMPSPQAFAQMVVRNVRNGQNVMVTVLPERRGLGTGPAPSVAAAMTR